MDSHNKSFGLDFEQAVTVLTTVISRPDKTRAIIDAGKKSISCDEGISSFTRQGLTLHTLNEEHGHVRIDDPDTDLSVGDKLEIVPIHGCTTIPIYDHYILIRNNHVESIEPIQARHAI
jgi:D-serine deaminase-like pyridoxal phosphate-dependent protein